MINEERFESNSSNNYKNLIKISVVCSVLIIILTILDIVIGTALGGDLNAIPETAIDRFAQLQSQPLLGLYYLDVLNMIISILMVPVFLSLFILQKSKNKGLMLLTIIVFIIGTVIFISNNAGLAMLGLSKQYAIAATSQKDLIAAAGESLLSNGAHGSMGAFLGFSLSMIATILMSISMIQTKVFGKLTGWIGLLGSILLFVYLILVTFIPNAQTVAMALAAPGGIMSLVWMVLYTLKLYKELKNFSRSTKLLNEQATRSSR